MEDIQPFNKRRLFLAAAVCAPVLAVAAAIQRRQAVVQASLPEKSTPSPAAESYHETEHIRKYYRLAGML